VQAAACGSAEPDSPRTDANMRFVQIVKARSLRRMGRIQDKLQEARRSSSVSAASGKAGPASSPMGGPLQDMWGMMGSLVVCACTRMRVCRVAWTHGG
jgi:hypothetical protein